MKYKLIAFDLDGTFLDDEKNIPPRNMEALKAAAEKGIHIAVATGRILAGVPEAIRALPFIRYFICINGAQVYDRVDNKVIYTAEIDEPTAQRVMDYMDTLPVIYDCYQDDFGWMSQHMYDRAEEFVTNPGILRLVKGLRRPVPDLKETLRERGRSVQKQQMFFKDIALRDRQLELLPGIFPELLFTTSVTNNIEINHADAAKGKALKALCEALGFSAEEAMAFGDGSNDIDMLSCAGMGVAMANASPAVIAAADYVTLTNNEAGVAAAIEKLAL